MAKKKNQRRELHPVDLTNIPEHKEIPDIGSKGGRSVAGKDLSTTQSSGRKGRKSPISARKIEDEAK